MYASSAACVTTIRIDLTELEQKGLLSRTHGGAILKEDPVYGEDSISSRREKNKEEKECIAKKARAQIEDGDTILLDSGTTALDLAELLKDIHNLFLDTGVSNDSYAIIELGMVDDIIKDKDHNITKKRL